MSKKKNSCQIFINTARGGIVNERDLIDALKNRAISGVCLDVFESEPLATDSGLRKLSNVIFVNNVKCVENDKEPESKLNQLL